MKLAPKFTAHSLLGFYAEPHYRRTDKEAILAIMYDEHGKATHALTDRNEYGFTYCADGPTVLDEGCGCIETDDNGCFMIDHWSLNSSAAYRVWLHPHHVGSFSLGGNPLTRDQALACGWQQLDTPLLQNAYTGSFDPFEDTTHADTIHYYWCSVCLEHYTSEGVCHHMKWQEGGCGFSLGCGSEDLDERLLKEAKTSLFHLLRLLPPSLVQRCHEQLKEGTFCLHCPQEYYCSGSSEITSAVSKTRKITHTDHKGKQRQIRLFHHTVEIHHEHLGDEGEAADLYWPGLAWLGSLDDPERRGGSRTQSQYALTLGWSYEFRQTGRHTILPDTSLHLTIDAKLFDTLLDIDPNDEDALEAIPSNTITFRRRDLDHCRNTEQFLLHPTSSQHIHLKRRRKKDDHYQSLTYRCEIQPYRRTKRGQLHYRATLKRCLDHNGKHPSLFDTYRVVRL